MDGINTYVSALEQCKSNLYTFQALQEESISRINAVISAIHDSDWNDKRANDIVAFLENVKAYLQKLTPELEKGVADVTKLVDITQSLFR